MKLSVISAEASAWLDWIRALAAIIVFVGHLRIFCLGDFSAYNGNIPLYIKAFYHISGLGHQAVIVFFVLSGFLVGGSVLKELTETGGLRIYNYIVARIARIHSVLVPALLLGGLADWIGLHIVQAYEVYERRHYTVILHQSVSGQLDFSTLLANLACLQTIVRPVLGSNSPLWSLANEFWYYFLFPALLITVWPGTPLHRRFVAGLIAVVIIWMLGLTKNLYFVFWLAGVGVRLAPSGRAIPGWIILFLFLGVLEATQITSSQIALMEWLGVTGSDALVAASFSTFLWVVISHPIRLPTSLARLGKLMASCSYTLYACHFPLAALFVAILIQMFGWVLPGDVLRWNTWAVFVTAILLLGSTCLLISLATERQHYHVKRWLLRLREPWLDHS